MPLEMMRLLRAPVQYKFWKPLHLKLVFKDLFGSVHDSRCAAEQHLDAALAWIGRAQDHCLKNEGQGGIAAGWNFEDGWLPGYPETSGYLIETLITAGTCLDRKPLLESAQRIIDWELAIQLKDGSFPGHFGEPGSRPVIFNTGQIMHGMAAGYLHFGREECLQAGVRAGQWLVEKQDSDGCWRTNVHNNIPHTYNTRTAWALLRIGQLADDRVLKKAAVDNLEWALTQQTSRGWFAGNGFTRKGAPYTHTIAYALRGLLESGFALQDERFIEPAFEGAKSLSRLISPQGFLSGTFADGWIPEAGYCCLTGLAQIAIIWKRLQQAYRVEDFTKPVQAALIYLKSSQALEAQAEQIRGGLPGSRPIWGAYSRFEFPNWALKFFIDLLLMEQFGVVIPELSEPLKPKGSTEENHCERIQ